MHKIDEALYFVEEFHLITELNTFWRYRFRLLSFQTLELKFAAIEKKLDKDAEAEEKNNYFKRIKSERIHTLTQL
jgi:hypothetical protein